MPVGSPNMRRTATVCPSLHPTIIFLHYTSFSLYFSLIFFHSFSLSVYQSLIRPYSEMYRARLCVPRPTIRSYLLHPSTVSIRGTVKLVYKLSHVTRAHHLKLHSMYRFSCTCFVKKISDCVRTNMQFELCSFTAK